MTDLRTESWPTGRARMSARYSNSPWTDALVTKLRELLAGDPMSASEIAASLGVPRSAVVGKVHRLGLKMPRDKKQAAAAMRRPESRRSRYYEGSTPRPANAPVEFLGITLMELKDGQCKFPRGENAPFLFCGRPQQPGSSYCPDCYRVTHNTHYSRFETQEERALRIRAFQQRQRSAPQ